MTRILIVDDNKNNRMTLQFLLEDFEDENPDHALALFQAENGQEAVHMCQKEAYDIIFMDIMMPQMDGIEATKLIRAIHPKNVLIVACSALSDNEHKNQILSAGAEDYITKPIDGKVFTKRIGSYINLIQHRQRKTYNVDAENVISNTVFSRKTVFMVRNETTLIEFWEYTLLESQWSDSEKFADLMRLLYGLGTYQVRQKFNFTIYLEENEENLYFTMDNMILLKQDTIEKLIQKNCPNADYKFVGNKITFCFSKQSSSEPAVELPFEPATEIKAEPLPVVTKSASAKKPEADLEPRIFDFMDHDDVHELEEITRELRSLFNLLGSTIMTENDIFQISFFIQKFASILAGYHETFAISASLKLLSSDISENAEIFQEKTKDLGSLCDAFNRDLTLWVNKLFFEGAPSIDFLDSSIISNANMISSFIKPAAAEEAAVLDDIFDF